MPPAPLAALALLAAVRGALANTCSANVGSPFDVAPNAPRPLTITNSSQCSCASYGSSACCTDAYVAAVKEGPGALYKGWSFDQCGRTMGPSCRAFMKAQECNYACDPRVSANYAAQGTPAFAPIRVCGSYCDAWFAACKNELTCSSDWLNWVQDPAQGYVCNATAVGAPMQPCRTFGETFVNAQGLCGLNPTQPGGIKGLWAQIYTYAADNTNWCVLA
jgi:folate receptor